MSTPAGLRAQQTLDMLNSDWQIGPVGVGTLAAPKMVNQIQTMMEKLWWDRPFTFRGVDLKAGAATLQLTTSYGAQQEIRIHTADDTLVDGFDLTTLAPTIFGSPAAFGGGFGNPFASHGQPIGWPSHQPFGAFGTQAVFGGLGSQFGQHAFGQLPFGQPIGGWHGNHQLSGLGPQTFFSTPWSQLGQQVFGQPIAPQSLFGSLPGQYGQPMVQVGAWPGQASILNQQLAGTLARGFQPYQSVPQLAYAG